MTTGDHTIDMQDICTIQIAFAVESDEQAIQYKRKISDVLADIPNARIEFSLMPMPKRIKANASHTPNPNQ